MPLAIEDYPPPANIKELQAFHDIINFYRCFLPGAARVLLPLTECLHGGKAAKEQQKSGFYGQGQ
jgi:hypothetical protein